MKYALLLIAGIFVSCKKESSTVTTFAGKWKLLSAVGGFAGKRITPSRDTVIILSLNNDKSYQSTLNGQITKTGNYETSVKTSSAFNTSGQAITYDNVNWQFIIIKNDTLFLDDPYPDGYGSAYIKVK